MKMTWTQTPTSDKDAFAAIEGGIDTLPFGAFLNSCWCASLDIVSAFRLTQFSSA